MKNKRGPSSASLRGSPNCTPTVAAELPKTQIAAFPTSADWELALRLLADVESSHRDKESFEYNMCDQEGSGLLSISS